MLPELLMKDFWWATFIAVLAHRVYHMEEAPQKARVLPHRARAP